MISIAALPYIGGGLTFNARAHRHPRRPFLLDPV